MDSILHPGTAPFWIALLTVVGLGVVEIVSLLLGISVSGLLEDGLDIDVSGEGHAGLLGGWISWLNAGGVPIFVLAIVLLSAFAAAGIAIQAIVSQFSEPLPLYAACTGALAVAIPATRWASRGLARIVPHDETSAQEQADFIGLTGVVTLGPLDQGQPGAVRVKDCYDNIHNLRAQAEAGYVIETGRLVLIVEGRDGVFQAIPAPASLEYQDRSISGV
jgi:hypothetical protein